MESFKILKTGSENNIGQIINDILYQLSFEDRTTTAKNIEDGKFYAKFKGTNEAISSYTPSLRHLVVETIFDKSELDEDFICCTNSQLMIGYMNKVKYAMCGSDASDYVKSYADYVCHFPLGSEEFDIEAAFQIVWYFIDAANATKSTYRERVLEMLWSRLSITPGTHIFETEFGVKGFNGKTDTPSAIFSELTNSEHLD